MSKRLIEEKNYPFYWLDELAEITLNPDKNAVEELKPPELAAIRERLPEEFSRINAHLKNQAFCLYSSDHIKVVAGHYDQAIRLLQEQVKINLTQYPASGPLRETGQQFLEGLASLSQNVQKRYPDYLPAVNPNDPDKQAENPINLLDKVLCSLSADQLGILTRAAFDVKLIIGQSFRKVCKAIAPFLSTPWKTDIKPDTMRSHGSRPEIRDNEVAIAILEKMIEKIRGYR